MRFARGMQRICVYLLIASIPAAAAELRLGMIGLDTSHVVAFTSLLNKTNSKDYIPGGKVVAAFKGGSPDVVASSTRVEGYAKQLQEQLGVKIGESIEELSRQV